MIGNGTMREKSQYKVQSTMIMEKEELVMAMITCPECGKEISDKSKNAFIVGKYWRKRWFQRNFAVNVVRRLKLTQ